MKKKKQNTREKNWTNRRKENRKKMNYVKNVIFLSLFFRQMINNVIQLTFLQFIY